MSRQAPVTLDLGEASKFINGEFEKANDRAVAVVSAALLDEQLTELVKDFLVPDARSDAKLFKGANGVLSTFSAKIEIGFRLGLISSQERRLLHFVRDVRNGFAHVFGPMAFTDASIADRCLAHQVSVDLISPQWPDEWDGEDIPTPAIVKDLDGAPRELFKEVIAFLVEALSARKTAAEDMRCKEVVDFKKWSDLVKPTEERLGKMREMAVRVLATPNLDEDDRHFFIDNIAKIEAIMRLAARGREVGEQALDEWKSRHGS